MSIFKRQSRKGTSDWRQPVGIVGPKGFVAFSDGDDHSFSSIAEIHLSGTDQREEDGFVVKEILRTGEWPVIPMKGKVVNKPLRIVKDGPSNEAEGIISLAEVVENFKKVGINVQVPLSDDEEDDHKNLTSLNTGFVRDIWVTDSDNGSKLVAKIEFTEPEVKEKVLNGTYADVSCGIPWNVNSRGQKYGSTLEHVAITNRPFIDGLGPFLALSNKTETEQIAHFSDKPTPEAETTPKVSNLSPAQMLESAQEQIGRILGPNFKVLHIASEGFFVRNEELKTSWTIPFAIEEGEVRLATITTWDSTKDEGTPDPGEQKPPAPIQPVQESKTKTPEDELAAARRLREAHLGSSEQSTFTNGGGNNMPLTPEELEQLNLSELPEGQRVVFQKILEENSALAASNRTRETDKRIKELEEAGLKDFPGALKLYRRVMLADDGGPAVVTLSDDGKTKQPLTALAILDQFVEAIQGTDKKIHLSDQALASGNDIKPPVTAEGETKPLEERKAEMKAALFGGQK